MVALTRIRYASRVGAACDIAEKRSHRARRRLKRRTRNGVRIQLDHVPARSTILRLRQHFAIATDRWPRNVRRNHASSTAISPG